MSAVGDLGSRSICLTVQLDARNGNGIAVILKFYGITVFGGNGKLFGSVTNKEVAEAIVAQTKLPIDKKKVSINNN